MPYNFEPFKQKVDETREWLTREYQGLRTGRATPTLLDGAQVNAYGSRTPLKGVANISVEDARTLRVIPWDASLTKDIEKAIVAADLGVGTAVGDSGIRVIFPELTGERRQELVRVAKQKLEEARMTIRGARDEVWSDIQEKERSGDLTEDEKFRLKDDLQKLVDEANTGLEDMFKQKENEITTQ